MVKGSDEIQLHVRTTNQKKYLTTPTRQGILRN